MLTSDLPVVYTPNIRYFIYKYFILSGIYILYYKYFGVFVSNISIKIFIQKYIEQDIT